MSLGLHPWHKTLKDVREQLDDLEEADAPLSKALYVDLQC